MPYTVSQLKDGIAGILTGTDIDTVTGANEAIQRAIRTTATKISIPEASAKLSYMLYAGVADYLAPPLIFGGSFTDFRPQGAVRNYNDYVYRKQIEDFDRTKTFTWNGVNVTFEFVNGTPILRATSARTTPKVTLDSMNSITGWVAGGSASGLAVDSSVYYQSPGALRFNLAVSGSQGYLEKTFTNPINLTSYQGVGVQFLAVYLPTATNITSVGVRLGSSNANYYDVSNTVGQTGAFMAGNYFLIPLNLANATPAGSPDITKIQYARIYFNYDGTALANVRVGAFFISLPFPYELLFQTSAIFLSNIPNAVPLQTITNNNDLVMLLDDAYNIFQHEAAAAIAEQNGGSLSGGILSSITSRLNGARARNGTVITYGLYDLYRAAHPSEEIKVVGNYYDDGNQKSGRLY